MSFNIIEEDITKLDVDVIVNAANSSLLGGGGVDGAIHKAAGDGLLEECSTLGGCKTGDAKLTKGYNLLASYVIHTVGPIWRGGDYREEILLRSCYKKSLEIAKERKLKSIAFPLISSGVYGYPMSAAIDIAMSEIKKFLKENDMKVILVIFNRESFIIPDSKIRDEISNILRKKIVDQKDNIYSSQKKLDDGEENIDNDKEKKVYKEKKRKNFTEELAVLIDKNNISIDELYKKANIDEDLLKELKNSKLYCPSKNVLISISIALKLNIADLITLLGDYGYNLSDSSIYDIIIKYFIDSKNYDLFKINSVLFKYGEKLLGF
ncbi:MAG: macro domain-containing protein [Peptostreptococcus sp.]|uniref:macro domain-containing protein n=1 Tax=Peptostreptococcus sp. TaxID=1262 RepID=UPI002FC8D2B7